MISKEQKAEIVKEYGRTPEDTGSPEVKCKSDPRPNGKPYFRYSTYLGDSTDEGFWKNSIAGLPWAQVPLVYTEKSNNLMDFYSFQASRRDVQEEYNNVRANRNFSMSDNFANFLGGTASSANIKPDSTGSFTQSSLVSAKSGIIGGGISYLSG